MSNTEITAFVANLTLHGEHEPMTYDDAFYTLNEWVKEGMELPEGLTARILADEWNSMIECERSITMSNESKKMIVPCDVEIRRFYRMYVTVGEDASDQEIADAVHSELREASDQDAILTPDPDLDIEARDVLEIHPDVDGSRWVCVDEPFENDSINGATRESDMRRVARSAMNILRLTRPDRKLAIGYVKPNDKTIERYTEWQRNRHGIRTGDEYFLVWDCAPDYTHTPELLYAVNVSIDSLLCAAWELFGLLSKKF